MFARGRVNRCTARWGSSPSPSCVSSRGRNPASRDGQDYGGAEPGDLRLVFWGRSGSRLRLETGVGVGSALSDLTDVYPTMTLGTFEECAGSFNPAGFAIDSEAGTVSGSVDWDWVSEVQRALDDRGATLAVDGEYGPVTRAIVAAFQAPVAIDPTASWDSDGRIGPQTLAVLGVSAPATAQVRGLRAGHPGSC